MNTFAVRVYGLPMVDLDAEPITISRIAITRKLRHEQGAMYRSVDPDFIAMKKKVVSLLQKIRKDLKRIEKHYVKRY